MRNLRLLDGYRIMLDETPEPSLEGIFIVKSKVSGQLLQVIASNDFGWDHVSVSLKNRCPNWYEMEEVRRLFFEDREVCWQYHVPENDHINIHPNVLHIWRKHDFDMPMPPKEFV